MRAFGAGGTVVTHHGHHHHELPANPLADLRLRRPPFWMISAFLIFVVVSWIPLVVGARRRVATSEDPRIQLPQDMGTQPKFKAQFVNPLFADGRADRPQVAGTVSRENLQNDDFYFRGWTRQNNQITFFKGFPPQVTVNLALLQRGENRFDIYCSACHGYDGRMPSAGAQFVRRSSFRRTFARLSAPAARQTRSTCVDTRIGPLRRAPRCGRA